MKTKTPMKHITKSISTVLLMTVATSFTLNAAVLMVYDTIGIDFGTTAPADPDTTFNQFSGSGIAGGSSSSLSAGTLSTTTASTVDDVGFTFTNNTSIITGGLTVAGTDGIGSYEELVDHSSVYADGIQADGIGTDNFTFTFTGLNDNLSYILSIGLHHGNQNFHSDYTVNGTTLGSWMSNRGTGIGYVTFFDQQTDGNGNIVITQTERNGANRVATAALTLTSVPEPSSTALLGLGLSSLLLRRRRA